MKYRGCDQVVSFPVVWTSTMDIIVVFDWPPVLGVLWACSSTTPLVYRLALGVYMWGKWVEMLEVANACLPRPLKYFYLKSLISIPHSFFRLWSAFLCSFVFIVRGNNHFKLLCFVFDVFAFVHVPIRALSHCTFNAPSRNSVFFD